MNDINIQALNGNQIRDILTLLFDNSGISANAVAKELKYSNGHMSNIKSSTYAFKNRWKRPSSEIPQILDYFKKHGHYYTLVGESFEYSSIGTNAETKNDESNSNLNPNIIHSIPPNNLFLNQFVDSLALTKSKIVIVSDDLSWVYLVSIALFQFRMKGGKIDIVFFPKSFEDLTSSYIPFLGNIGSRVFYNNTFDEGLKNYFVLFGADLDDLINASKEKSTMNLVGKTIGEIPSKNINTKYYYEFEKGLNDENEPKKIYHNLIEENFFPYLKRNKFSSIDSFDRIKIFDRSTNSVYKEIANLDELYIDFLKDKIINNPLLGIENKNQISIEFLEIELENIIPTINSFINFKLKQVKDTYNILNPNQIFVSPHNFIHLIEYPDYLFPVNPIILEKVVYDGKEYVFCGYGHNIILHLRQKGIKKIKTVLINGLQYENEKVNLSWNFNEVFDFKNEDMLSKRTSREYEGNTFSNGFPEDKILILKKLHLIGLINEELIRKHLFTLIKYKKISPIELELNNLIKFNNDDLKIIEYALYYRKSDYKTFIEAFDKLNSPL